MASIAMTQTVFSKEMVQFMHLIFWPGSQRRIHYHNARKLNPTGG
jgi:hypothetical protein